VTNPSKETGMLAWWFNRGIGSVATVPIFIALIIGMLASFWLGLIQTLAYLRVTPVVFGVGGFIGCLFVWPFSLILPGSLWWAAITTIPNVILRSPFTAIV
jgi:hypothetical protein